jgi:hypothetical protein
MAVDPNVGITPMLQSFSQFNKAEEPEDDVHAATAAALANPTKPATGAIKTKAPSIVDQARQIYNTQAVEQSRKNIE